MSAANVRHPVPVFEPHVLDEIYRHTDGDPENEVGGLLLGVEIDGARVVTAAIEAVGADGDVTSLTFTHDSWAAMLAVADRDHEDAEIMGWYHSHPGHGIFLSEHDRFIHRNFFSAPWHVALVVDPQRHTEGLFGWSDGSLELLAGEDHDPIARRPRRVNLDVATADPSPPGPAVARAALPGVAGLVIPSLAGVACGVLAALVL